LILQFMTKAAAAERRGSLRVGFALGEGWTGKETNMRMHFGHAAIAFALVAGPQTAAAQQWIYTPDRIENRAVAQPLPLTQAQRTIIYRTIIPQGRGRGPIVREQIITEPVTPAVPLVRERVVTEPLGVDAYAYGGYAPAPRYAEPEVYGAYAYAVGTRVPPSARLAPLPPSLVTQFPAVSSYRYIVVAGRLLLVDPNTGLVVAEVTQ
jgi:Protein of unknown function (DUF1236)